MPESPITLIELRSVCHEYAAGSPENELVLSDVNLTVAERDVVVLLGPSGCGKSTLVRIMAGLIQPTRGEVMYRGIPLHGVSPGVAMVFQNFAGDKNFQLRLPAINQGNPVGIVAQFNAGHVQRQSESIFACHKM